MSVSDRLTAIEYIKNLVPSANITESTIKSVLFKARINPSQMADSLTEQQEDLAMAYLLILLFFSPSSSQKVTDRDGDWEHSEGGEQRTRAELRNYLRIAHNLLAKWDITDPIVESALPKWGFKGMGFRKICRYN